MAATSKGPGDGEMTNDEEHAAEETVDASAHDEPGDASEAADEQAGAEGEESAPARPNRKARRKRKIVGDDERVSDRNARLRQQLLSKQREAAAVEAQPLTAGEMVDDAFARAVASSGKWLKRNSTAVQVGVAAAIIAAIGYGVLSYRNGAKNERATGELMTAIRADRGVVGPAPTARTPGEESPLEFFKTPEERVTAAMNEYGAVVHNFPGTGAALLARLGEAGVLLDKKAYDEARKAYAEVRVSALASADPEVRGRATEGQGFAEEAKGDRDAALKTYRDLENVKGFQELAFYHEARMAAAAGDKDKTLGLVKSASDKLHCAKGSEYLQGALDDLRRRFDPSAQPTCHNATPGVPQLSEEKMRELQEQMRKAMQQKPGASAAPPIPMPLDDEPENDDTNQGTH